MLFRLARCVLGKEPKRIEEREVTQRRTQTLQGSKDAVEEARQAVEDLLTSMKPPRQPRKRKTQ